MQSQVRVLLSPMIDYFNHYFIEFDEPDEKDQVSSVDSLLFEWTTLAKEEVSSSASLVVTP